MTVKINKTVGLCPECHRFGVDENGICEYCGYDKYRITLEKAEERGIIYHKVYVDGEYIGFGFGEDDARAFGKRCVDTYLK